MHEWADFSLWRQHREELLQEAQERRLGREANLGRRTRARPREGPAVKVRWGLPEDEARIVELLELNGMPRWVAFEEPFAVAERDGAVAAAVRYRTEPKRLLLGLLVVDPWSEERTLAPTLYAEARTLALEIGAIDVVARTDRHRAAYLCGAGYHRWGAVWRMDLSRPIGRREELSMGGWRRGIGWAGAFLAISFFGDGSDVVHTPGERREVKEGRVEGLFQVGQKVPESQPFSALVGAKLANISEEEVVLEVPIRAGLFQQYGFVHGGVVSYLADDALPFAGGTVLGLRVLTSEYKINYLKPARGSTLVARASVVHAGRRQAVCRCDVFAAGANGDETFCATAQGTIVTVASPGKAR